MTTKAEYVLSLLEVLGEPSWPKGDKAEPGDPDTRERAGRGASGMYSMHKTAKHSNIKPHGKFHGRQGWKGDKKHDEPGKVGVEFDYSDSDNAFRGKQGELRKRKLTDKEMRADKRWRKRYPGANPNSPKFR